MIDESRRLAELRAYEVLDTPPDPILDHIVELASSMFDAPVACVSLVDARRLFLKASHGVDATELGPEPGMCVTTVRSNEPRQIPDLLADDAASQHPLVTAEPHLRFYAGHPLRSRHGFALGTVCVLDQRPRELSDQEMGRLEILAELAMHRLETLRDEAERAALDRRRDITGAAFSPVQGHVLGLVAFDRDGRIEYASHSATAVTGLRASAHVDDDPPAVPLANWHAVQAAWRDRDRPGGATTHLSSGDGHPDVELHLTAETSADGAVTGYVGMIHACAETGDIGARALEAQRLESLGAVAGGIAHDFNNILATIMGYSSLVTARITEDDAKARGYLANIDVAIEHARKLCAQLLSYSSGGGFTVSTLDLSDLVEDMHELIAVALSTTKAAVELDLAAELPPVRGDATQVRQVVLNVLANATESFEDQVGTIRLTTAATTLGPDEVARLADGTEVEPGDFALLRVTDDGGGIGAADIPHIFDPTYTTKFGGHGLGLAAVRSIMRAHGGLIDVASEPGQGTTVTLYFPAD